MKILHLTLKKKWFDMIASGEKPEEYRELKLYWWTRLVQHGTFEEYEVVQFKNYDVIAFKNGYSKNAPQMVIECKGIAISYGNPKWGAPDSKVFIIKLGKIISTTGKENSPIINI